MRVPWVVGAILIVAAPSTVVAADQTVERVYATAAPSVVSVVARRGADTIQGSAVALSPSTFVTAYHVVRHTWNIELVADGVTARAMLLALDRQADLAVVRLLEDGALAVRQAKLPKAGAPKVGTRVYAIGSPRGLTSTISEGIISGLRAQAGREVLQTTSPISPGSSGGGLFDSSGRLLGVTLASIVDGQALNFAVPSAVAVGLMSEPCNDVEVAIRWPNKGTAEVEPSAEFPFLPANTEREPVPLPAGLSPTDSLRCQRLFKNLMWVMATASQSLPMYEKHRRESCDYVWLDQQSPFFPPSPTDPGHGLPTRDYNCSSKPVFSTSKSTWGLFECCPASPGADSLPRILCLQGPATATDGFTAFWGLSCEQAWAESRLGLDGKTRSCASPRS